MEKMMKVSKEPKKRPLKNNGNENENNWLNNNTTIFFLIFFLGSICFNVWTQLNKSQEQSPLLNVKQFDSLVSALKSIQNRLDRLEGRSPLQENKIIENIKIDDKKLESMFSIEKLCKRAREAEPHFWFASNQTRATVIAQVAQFILQQSVYTCEQKIPTEFDVYRNCFRSLAIEFHNRLSLLFRSHWFTTVGRQQYSFLVTTMLSRRNEYIFSIDDIYFQVIEYDQMITMPVFEPDQDDLNEEKLSIENQTESSNESNINLA